VQTNVTYTLSANVENITITGTSGTVTGNDLDNIFTGAAGVDNMTGLGGNDTYFASTSDVITEGLNAGTDTVSSAVTWALGANLENLILSGTTNVSGTGNTLDNVITGNSGVNTLTGNDGNDTLYGMGGVDTLNGGNGNDTFIGGLGADTLTGGAGLDIFMFDIPSLGTIDTITDFSTAQGDVLNIHDLLVGYNPVSSAIAEFLQITDNGANSNVSVDRDGTGATYGWAQIATLSNVIGLTDEALLLANYNIAV
jgi:Ca2+-binding RTX toxin-like protein